MTSESPPLHLEITPRRPRPRPAWGRALRAMRELVRNPDRTHLAFEINKAVDPGMHDRALAHLLAHPEGRRLYAERPCLLTLLSDRKALEEMPEGSFGRAYLQHLDRHGLDPAKLVALGRETKAISSDPDVCWMGERAEMAHDLWHVLTGYGADPAGESALLLFSLAQIGGRGNVILSLGANLRMTRDRGLGWIPFAWRAWGRGRHALCLQALPYEKLLPLPLEEVRRAAGIEAPGRAQPGADRPGDRTRSDV